jgi:hypothetical protein
LARWIVVSSTACSSCRRGCRERIAVGLEQRGVLRSVLPDASATCLLEHLEFDPLGAPRALVQPRGAAQVANEPAGGGDGGERIADSAG